MKEFSADCVHTRWKAPQLYITLISDWLQGQSAPADGALWGGGGGRAVKGVKSAVNFIQQE